MDSYSLGGSNIFHREIEEELAILFLTEQRIFGFDIEITKELRYHRQALSIKPRNGFDELYVAEEDSDIKLLRLYCDVKCRTFALNTTIRFLGNHVPFTVIYYPEKGVIHFTDELLQGNIIFKRVPANFKYYPVKSELVEGELQLFRLGDNNE